MWKVLSFLVLSVFFVTIEAQALMDSCLQCQSSALHPECIFPDSSDFGSACISPANNGSCFSRVTMNGSVIRGCLGELDNATATECDSETCQICGGHNCNVGLFPPNRIFCHICSGGINSTCAGNITAVMTVCPTYVADDRCYIARPNGNFERGCLSSATTRCEHNSCHICPGSGCNFVDYNSAINVNFNAKMLTLIGLSLIFTMINK